MRQSTLKVNPGGDPPAGLGDGGSRRRAPPLLHSWYEYGTYKTVMTVFYVPTVLYVTVLCVPVPKLSNLRQVATPPLVSAMEGRVVEHLHCFAPGTHFSLLYYSRA